MPKAAKLAPVPKPARKLPLDLLIDEYAEVRSRMMAWPNVNPHAERFEELEQEILRRQENQPKDKALILEGKTFKLPVSAKRFNRWLLAGAVEKLFTRWGKDTFLSVCSPAFGVIDKLVPDKKERATYFGGDHTGARTLGEPVKKIAEVPK